VGFHAGDAGQGAGALKDVSAQSLLGHTGKVKGDTPVTNQNLLETGLYAGR